MLHIAPPFQFLSKPKAGVLPARVAIRMTPGKGPFAFATVEVDVAEEIINELTQAVSEAKTGRGTAPEMWPESDERDDDAIDHIRHLIGQRGRK